MEQVIKNIVVKYDIDFMEYPNMQLLSLAYEDEKGLDEEFQKSLGHHVEPLDVRVYKRFKRQKDRYGRYAR